MNLNPTERQLARFGCAFCMAILVGMGWLLSRAVTEARDAAFASAAKGPLVQLALALHNYHEIYSCLPPAYIADDHGNPIHSWRALLLPYVDAPAIHREYRFDEPWNGPNNIKLAHRMPSIYRCPSEPDSPRFTNYVAIVGPNTAFPVAGCRRFDQFTDGMDQTILLAEIADSDVPWLEPRDLRVGEMSFEVNDQHLPSISSNRKKGPYVLFANRRVHWLSHSLSGDAVRALATVDGREPLALAELENEGIVELSKRPATDATLSEFNRWASVRSLWLSGSPISDQGLIPLRRIPYLICLDLSQTPISDDALQHITHLSTCYTLNLSHTRITNSAIPYLHQIETVHQLDVSHTEITDKQFADLRFVTAGHLRSNEGGNGSPQSVEDSDDE